MNVALASFSQLDHPFDCQQLRLTASIGISIYPEDGEDVDSLIACADAAMYDAKKRGHAEHAPDLKPTGAPVALQRSRQRPRSLRESANIEQAQRETDLRDANESLILAALGAQELRAAAEEARRRQAELLALVASELSGPHAAIRPAASILGSAGAEAPLLRRVQAVIEEQAERLAGMVRDVLEQ